MPLYSEVTVTHPVVAATCVAAVIDVSPHITIVPPFGNALIPAAKVLSAVSGVVPSPAVLTVPSTYTTVDAAKTETVSNAIIRSAAKNNNIFFIVFLRIYLFNYIISHNFLDVKYILMYYYIY